MRKWANTRLAIADSEASLSLMPDDTRTCNNLAWLLATCSDETLRNPARAVELARTACERLGEADASAFLTRWPRRMRQTASSRRRPKRKERR